MRKHFKLLTICIVLVLGLTAGLSATVLAGDTPGTDEGKDENQAQVLIEKAAGILGMESDELAEALQQAKEEMKQEAVEERLQEAVEKGLITQEEAEVVLEWWQARPDVLEDLKRQPQLLQPQERVQRQWRQCGPLHPVKALAGLLDEWVRGTVSAVSQEDSAITVTTPSGEEVTFEYTRHTVVHLRGAIAVEVGQKVLAGCWEDKDGNLTARIVWAGTPLEVAGTEAEVD